MTNMKAIATRTSGETYRNEIDIRQHQLTADEPTDKGGEDQGPTPQELLAASLAGCMAITMEMYAQRKGWSVGELGVECQYEQAERDQPTTITVILRLPDGLSPEQVERLSAIAAKCPVHRTLEGEVIFDQRVELDGR
jgi:putative redox protein